MTEQATTFTAGVDAGTTCVKAIIASENGSVCGRAVVEVRGYFQECAQRALSLALDDAQVSPSDLRMTCATGYAAETVPGSGMTAPTPACLALGAFRRTGSAMTLIDIGGQDPTVVHIDAGGRRSESRSLRKCATGTGAFLDMAARRLDVHPSRLQTLACEAEVPSFIGNYCSVFANTEINERLRNGASSEEVALGCIQSIADRIFEVGGFQAPLMVSGGVPEYYPGVLKALAARTGFPVTALPEPIMTGALGSALKALQAVTTG